MDSSKKITKGFIQDFISDSTQAELDNLQDQINSLPPDSGVVHKTGNLAESIDGLKTFTDTHIIVNSVLVGNPRNKTSETVLGAGALLSSTNGGNTAIGSGALAATTSGSSNVGLGFSPLAANTTGSFSVGIGYRPFLFGSNIQRCIGIGREAARFFGTGSSGLTTATNSIFIGEGTRAFADSGFNEIVIGSFARGAGSNTAVIGDDANIRTVLKGNTIVGQTGIIVDNAVDKLQVNGTVISSGYKTTGGLVSQFLKANGTVDSTNYQPLLINPITGTGTSNRLVKWLTTTQTGNSLLYDNGTNVGIGTTSPTTPLYITNASGTQLTLDAAATASRLDMSLGGVALGRLQYDTSNGILLGTNTANHITFLVNNSTVGRINGTTANLTIGSVTDNAVDKLQVVGSISATSATFTAGNVTLGATTVTENRLKLNSYQSSTGITSFGAGGIAITSGTTFDVAAVTGFIVSSTDPLNIPPIPVSYPGATGLTTPYIGSAAATYLLVNSSNALVMQNTRPTTTERRNMIYLGVIGHSAGTLGGVGNSPDIIMNEMSQVRAMFEPTKLINENIRCYNNSTNLTLANTAGRLYGFGIGFIPNGNDAPSILNIAAGTPTVFQYRTQTGTATGNLTSIVPGSYDVGGVVTAIPVTGTRFSNQRIYILENGAIRIQYGQVLYYTLVEAVSGADKESFTAFPNNSNLGLLIGILSVSKDCTDLSNTDQARFLPVNKFGETIGASSGQAGGYLLASLTSSANVDQALTNTISTIAFDTDDNTAYGGISRSGSSFTILSSGNYQFIIQPQVTQNVNNNVTTIWCRKNGVNVPRSAVRSEVAAAGDEFILPLVVTADLVATDVITFHAITSAINGSTLEFTAAAGVVPDIPAAILDIKGWKK